MERFTRNRALPVQSPVRARKAADAVRRHWAIENKQHYTRDVTLCEDASRIRRNPGISSVRAIS
jgi:predicted transposase YbfD/YdcC